MLKKIYISLPYIIGVVGVIIGITGLNLSLKDYQEAKLLFQAIGDGKALSFSEELFNTMKPKLVVISMAGILISIAFVLLKSIILAELNNIKDDILILTHKTYTFLNHLFKNNNRLHGLALLVVIVVGVLVRISHINHPIRYDEAFTLYSYVNSPTLFTISNYSFPNNHIFHSLLVQLSTFVFGESLFAIRLPALLAGILLLPLSYSFAKEIFNKHIALVSTALLACCYPLIDYSVNARGYTLTCLFTLLLLLLILKQNNQKAHYSWVIIVASLGLYTIPIFAYPFGIVLFLSILKNKKIILKPVLIYSIGTVALTTLLYTPVLLYKGLNALIANEFIVKHTYQELPLLLGNNLFKTFTWFTNNGHWSVVGIALLALIIGAFMGNKRSTSVLLSILLSLTIILFIQRVNPPIRVWLFLLPLLLPFIVQGVFFYVRNNKVITTVISLFIVLSGAIYLHIHKFNLSPSKEIFVYEELAKTLKKVTTKNDKLVAQLPIDYPLSYYLEKHHVAVKLPHVYNGGYSDTSTNHRHIYIIADERYKQNNFMEALISSKNTNIDKQYEHIVLYKHNPRKH